MRKAVEENTIEALVQKYQAISNPNCDNDVKTTVDQAFRKVLNEAIIASESTWKLEQIINQSIIAAERDACSGSLPLLLISDLFDCLTLDRCEQLFSLVEDRVNIWKRDFFFKHCKNQLLRSCNDLLRRLSRSQNTVFCGRILVFLARFFPLSERSGLNIISEFNLDNVTLYSSQDDLDNHQDKDEPMEEKRVKEPEKAITVDYNLYRKFWSLQDYFRQPTLCYNKISWKQFQSYSSNVLAAFGSFKLDDVKSTRWKLPHISNISESEKPVYFAKYLTNQKLLELELSDSNFRRCTLIQFLILFQYLQSSVKFKQETFLLSEDQSNWIKETTELIYKLLGETPPNGIKFGKDVEKILKREEYWNNWKNEGCPDFKKVEEEIMKSPSKFPRQKQKLGDELRAAAASKKVLLGNTEMNRLWNVCPDNWEACRSQKRDFVPSLESFFVKAIDEMDATKQIEEKEKRVSESHFQFRALRLLSQKSPHFFTQSNQPIGQIPRYLENMVSKLAKELPQNSNRSLTDDKSELAAAADDSEDELLHNTEESISRNDHVGDSDMSFDLVTKDLIGSIAEVLRGSWKQLAPKLNFQDTDISFFASDTQDVVEQGRRMMTSWVEEKGDSATVAVLKMALEKAGLAQMTNSCL